MKNLKIYVCEICGNIVLKIEDKTEALFCCGEPMVLLENKTEEGLGEKHLPVVNINEENGIFNIDITVGEVLHPMIDEHFIQFIILEYQDRYDIAFLNPEKEPKANFVSKEKPIAVYEYCNLHGLWKKEI